MVCNKSCWNLITRIKWVLNDELSNDKNTLVNKNGWSSNDVLDEVWHGSKYSNKYVLKQVLNL